MTCLVTKSHSLVLEFHFFFVAILGIERVSLEVSVDWNVFWFSLSHGQV